MIFRTGQYLSLFVLLLLVLSLLSQQGNAFAPLVLASPWSSSSSTLRRRLHSSPPPTTIQKRSTGAKHTANKEGQRQQQQQQLPPAVPLYFYGTGSEDYERLGRKPIRAVTRALQTWFQRIRLPDWMPEQRVEWIVPVASVCYVCLGLAVVRLGWIHGGNVDTATFYIWGFHYLLNLVGAELLFGMQRLRASLRVNVVLLLSMPFVLKLYSAIDPIATSLIVPYAAWVLFGTILNWNICKLNPTDEGGYNNAMLEADIVQMQSKAAEKVGLIMKIKQRGVYFRKARTNRKNQKKIERDLQMEQ